MTQEMTTAVTLELDGATASAMRSSSVVTTMKFAASPLQVWKALAFYEQIGERPPLHLRLLLPVPIRSEGRIEEVGDEAKCLYESGHLLKRVTQIQPGRLYEFEIAEQVLSLGGGMRLSGGRYALRELPDGQTEVALETRYFSSKWPRWFWKPLEAMVCHAFHRYLLRSIRRKIV